MEWRVTIGLTRADGTKQSYEVARGGGADAHSTLDQFGLAPRPSQTWGRIARQARRWVDGRTVVAAYWFCSTPMFGTVSSRMWEGTPTRPVPQPSNQVHRERQPTVSCAAATALLSSRLLSCQPQIVLAAAQASSIAPVIPPPRKCGSAERKLLVPSLCHLVRQPSEVNAVAVISQHAAYAAALNVAVHPGLPGIDLG